MYHPADPPAGGSFNNDDFEYLELQNSGSVPMDLAGASIAGGISFEFPPMQLAPGERTVVVKNANAFQSRYGSAIPIAGIYTGSLSNDSDVITLFGSVGQRISTFEYQDSWYPVTDGGGYSLVIANSTSGPSDLGSPARWRASVAVNGNPGSADPGPSAESVVINEVMTRSSTSGGDYIELKNTTDAPIEISGWFLSDSSINLTKYQIHPNTVIAANGYLVFYDGATYGNNSDPGTHNSFGLSANGTDVYLSSNDGAGNLGGYRESVQIAASLVNQSFGRFPITAGEDFSALLAPTPGLANSGPLPGSIIINEILYNPAPGEVEFIELHNRTAATVPLYDPSKPANTWKFLDGIDFVFPVGASLMPSEYALVVPIDPAIYRTTFNIPANVPVFGPYVGSLANEGENLELGIPANSSGNTVSYMTEDRINYGNQSPWPVLPLNSGASITRITGGWGNDPVSWEGGQVGGSPGLAGPQNNPPVVSFGSDTNATQGTEFVRAGSFVDADPGQYWTASVRWGDSDLVLPLTLTANHGFSLRHTYLNPGTYPVEVTVTDSSGKSGSASITITVRPGTRIGSAMADRYTIRLDPTQTYVQFYENAQTGVKPSYSIKRALLSSQTINAGNGNDILEVDLSNGNPLASAGLTFGGSANTDLVRIIGDGGATGISLSAGQANIGGIILSYSATERLQLERGTFAGNGDLAIGVTVGAGAVMTFNTSQHLSSLALVEDGRATLTPGGSKFLRTSAFSMEARALLDLADGAMIVQSNATNRGSVLSSIASLIKSARNGGFWNLPGITSSIAAADPQRLTGLAAILNETGPGTPLMGTFLGEAVDINSILVKYGYNGDSNLDGRIDADDYVAIDRGFILKTTGYANGDLNYDGAVDADDYFLIDGAFISQGSPPSPGVARATTAARKARKLQLHHRRRV